MERPGELSQGAAEGGGGNSVDKEGLLGREKGNFDSDCLSFMVCVGCWRCKDKDALDYKEGISFRAPPPSLASLGSWGAVLTMSHIHRAVLYLCRALSMEVSPNPLILLYLFLFTLVSKPKLSCLLELL